MGKEWEAFMKKVAIKLENCYGIKKFKKEFDFSDKAAFIIYASKQIKVYLQTEKIRLFIALL